MLRNVVSLLQEKFRKHRKARPNYFDDRGDVPDYLAGKLDFPASFFLIKQKCVKQAEIFAFYSLGTLLDYVLSNEKKYGNI